MSDETKICVDCGRPFELSTSRQRWFRERGLELPKRCDTCLARKRDANRPGMRGMSGPPNEPPATRPATYDNPFLRKSGPEAPPRRLRSWWNEPVYRYGALTVGLSLALAATIWYFGDPIDVLKAWLVAINLVAFLAYGYDKLIAGTQWMRVPEKVLLALAFIGGTIGALAGMWVFRHKTAKESFRLRFWMVVLAQVIIVAVYYLVIKPGWGW